MNVTVCDKVLCSIATAYRNRFILSEQVMQCIVTLQPALCQDKACPGEAGPPLVHYLRLHHRHEVEHLRAHNFNDVALPGLQVWRVAYQKEQDVLLWLLWKLWRFARTYLAFLLSLFRLLVQAPQVIVLA